MAQQHDVDRGKFFEREPGRMYAARPEPAEGAGALGENGIG
jgi:hypothetical protein